ncbi:MAG: hypothetical protein IT340_12575 [Chloroflexi bacterium]|nr:hypothetical protein [Chloroflexota bacterium]
MKLKKSDRAQLWAEAIRRCRLSPEAAAMARELGMNPRDLIKNIPAPSQPWKAPVEDWVRGLYAERQRRAERRRRREQAAVDETMTGLPPA